MEVVQVVNTLILEMVKMVVQEEVLTLLALLEVELQIKVMMVVLLALLLVALVVEVLEVLVQMVQVVQEVMVVLLLLQQ
jgi:hypothetical protein